MIKSHLKRLMQEKGIETYSELATLTQLSRPALRDLFKDDTERYSRKVLDGLCSFFNCKINKLIEFIPDRD